jgi:Protein of unknown function (DUF3467)
MQRLLALRSSHSIMAELKHVNFTIVPDDSTVESRVYANFCAIAHTPFDCTLSFCEVLPLTDQQIQEAQRNAPSPETQVPVRAPVKVKVVIPHQCVANLVALLQEHLRTIGAQPTGPVH